MTLGLCAILGSDETKAVLQILAILRSNRFLCVTPTYVLDVDYMLAYVKIALDDGRRHSKHGLSRP